MADKPGVASSFSDHSFDNDGNLTATGSANTYVVKTGRRIQGYFKGLRLCVRIPVTNTNASTLAVDEAGVIAIRKSGNAVVAAGDLVAGVYYDFIYDDANDVLQIDPSAGAGFTPVAGPGISISGSTFSTVLSNRDIADISGGGTVIASDQAKYINILTGTGTLAFTAAATLASGFWCVIKNSGTGEVTLNPNGAELIDGLATWVLYPGGAILVQNDGGGFRSVLLSPMQVTFNASGTFTKPGVGTWVELEGWGGGGSGGRGTGAEQGGGGGGGYNTRRVSLSSLGTTETVTIGAGGAARATSVAGAAGGTTTFGSLLSAFGGGAGNNANSAGGGGGGGPFAAGGTGASGGAQPGVPRISDGTNSQGQGGDLAVGKQAIWHGGGGGGGPNAGGASLYGGGGGGGNNTTTGASGGQSFYGGNGGASGVNGANGTNGTQPGGGGGSAEANGSSGAGGDGRIVVRVF